MLLRTIVIIAIAFAFCCSLYYSRIKRDPLNMMNVFLGVNLISEVVAFYLATFYKNNMPVFHIFNPLLFILLVRYLNSISITNKRYKIGLTLGVLAIGITSINTLQFQPIHSFNSNYLLLEGLFVCILGFVSLYDFERNDDELYPQRNPNFWMTVLLVFKQVIVFFLYIVLYLFDRITITDVASTGVIITYYVLWAVNVVGYLLMALIFLMFSKTPDR